MAGRRYSILSRSQSREVFVSQLFSYHLPAKPFFWATGAMLLILAIPGERVQAQQTTPAGDSPPSGNVEKGKRSFAAHLCSECHGFSGRGSERGSNWRTLNQTRLPWAAFLKYVRQPTGSMPAFRTQAQVSDADLADIYAYLKSIPPSPDPKSIPLLAD